MDELLLLRNLVESQLLTSNSLRDWAEARLSAVEPPAPWLADLVSVTSRDEALSVISDWIGRTNTVATRSEDLRLRLACLFRQYLARRKSLLDVLDSAGRAADAANADDPSCEAYYTLSKDIRNGKSAVAAEAAAHELFAPQLRHLDARLKASAINV